VEQLISSVIQGFPIGCVYALIAIGFVLTYKTSGVFNLAFGAQAFVSAAVYYQMRVVHGWPIPVAFVVSVLVVAPLLGLVLDRALFQHLRGATQVARLAVSLGLLVAIPEIAKLALKFEPPAFGPQGIVADGDVVYRFGDYAVTRNELITIVITIVSAVLLAVLFRYTALGLRMRAVVESPRMSELAGVNADRVSSVSWMLSSFFAGLAGVLLAPLFAQVNSNDLFTLITVAIAAAAFAGLTSLPLAFVGGIALGVLGQILARYLPTGSVVAQGLRPSLPFVALFLILILKPSLQRRREVTDPLAGVDPPPPALASDERSRALTIATYGMGAVASLVALWLFLVVLNNFWLGLATSAVIYSVIFLSITVFTGMAGQISLSQATFGAVGAFTTAQLVSAWNLPVLVTMVMGACVAAAVGAVLALPIRRLGGIYLALATLAFALFFENVMLKFSWISGGTFPLEVPRPVIGPFDFESDKSFFVLCIVILALVGWLVIRVRGGTTGGYLAALRGSEVAATSIGINPARARVTAFALSAGIAGLGGGLLSIQQGFANYQANFSVFVGLFWIVIVVTLGTRTVEGAIQAGIGFKFLPELLKALGLSLSWQYIFFGLGAITFARHPEGVLEHNKRTSLNFVQRQIDRWRGRGDDSGHQ
jgi:branched-chain amino acid transport system permease protein